MKKTYMIPATIVMKVETTQMIATSVDGFNGSLGSTGSDGSNALGRRGGNVWDDDEEF